MTFNLTEQEKYLACTGGSYADLLDKFGVAADDPRRVKAAFYDNVANPNRLKQITCQDKDNIL